MYKVACDKATEKSRKNTSHRGDASGVPNSKGVKRKLSSGLPDQVGGERIEISDTSSDTMQRRRDKCHKGDRGNENVQSVHDAESADNGGDIVARKLSSVSCGTFTTAEFARLVLILRSDVTLRNEYLRAVRELPTRLHRDRRKSATEHYRNGLSKAFNNPAYRVLGYIPLYIKKVCVDFSGRKRSGEELKHELSRFAKASISTLQLLAQHRDKTSTVGTYSSATTEMRIVRLPRN